MDLMREALKRRRMKNQPDGLMDEMSGEVESKDQMEAKDASGMKLQELIDGLEPEEMSQLKALIAQKEGSDVDPKVEVEIEIGESENGEKPPMDEEEMADAEMVLGRKPFSKAGAAKGMKAGEIEDDVMAEMSDENIQRRIKAKGKRPRNLAEKVQANIMNSRG